MHALAYQALQRPNSMAPEGQAEGSQALALPPHLQPWGGAAGPPLGRDLGGSTLLPQVLTSPFSPLDELLQPGGFKYHLHLTPTATLDCQGFISAHWDVGILN